MLGCGESPEHCIGFWVGEHRPTVAASGTGALAAGDVLTTASADARRPYGNTE
jgi:hypothetical protein